jgi:hypothetical protein
MPCYAVEVLYNSFGSLKKKIGSMSIFMASYYQGDVFLQIARSEK